MAHHLLLTGYFTVTVFQVMCHRLFRRTDIHPEELNTQSTVLFQYSKAYSKAFQGKAADGKKVLFELLDRPKQPAEYA